MIRSMYLFAKLTLWFLKPGLGTVLGAGPGRVYINSGVWLLGWGIVGGDSVTWETQGSALALPHRNCDSISYLFP
jgi:hypothetical protein